MDAKKLLPLVSAATALLGVALGAGLQYVTSSQLTTESRLLEFRTDAYRDFLDGQARLQRADAEQDDVARNEANRLIREASVRVAVFSTADVARSLADFLALSRGGVPCGHAAAADFDTDLAIYRAMRAETLGDEGSGELSDRALSLLVLACVPPTGEAQASGQPRRPVQ